MLCWEGEALEVAQVAEHGAAVCPETDVIWLNVKVCDAGAVKQAEGAKEVTEVRRGGIHWAGLARKDDPRRTRQTPKKGLWDQRHHKHDFFAIAKNGAIGDNALVAWKGDSQQNLITQIYSLAAQQRGVRELDVATQWQKTTFESRPRRGCDGRWWRQRRRFACDSVKTGRGWRRGQESSPEQCGNGKDLKRDTRTV